MLWLPAVLVLLCGLPVLLATGQVDPRGWMLAALLLAPVAAWLGRHDGQYAAFWASMGAAGTVLSCAFLATWRVPALGPVLWFLAAVLLATFAGLWTQAVRAPGKAGVRYGGASALVLLTLAAWWLAKEPRIAPTPGPRPQLAVMSGLPLFWRAGEKGLAARVDAPIITVLRQRFDVQPVDSPLRLGKAKLLLLAQPRAFSMEELVALHGWISRGGTALILADPQLRWPLDLPLGDRRRPPSVTLLSAMIELLGVTLLPRPDAGEVRHFLGDGRMLTLFAASGFEKASADCRIVGRGRVARCAVGKGSATMVADADLIDDRLWLADPAAPLDPAQWTADTPQFVAETLGQALPDGRRWVRTGAVLAGAVRWAVLVGFFWAALGTALFGPWNGPRFGLVRPRLARQKPERKD
ncbi:hypothetical protein [Sphingobium estronivorans]|uniref:hypothetical protein n=1 Tax=Sphingobium estronivorans TaxID=1577690 RepID=UPI0019679CF6|nr:hypothetical protein [Sphingobium estronivorans]